MIFVKIQRLNKSYAISQKPHIVKKKLPTKFYLFSKVRNLSQQYFIKIKKKWEIFQRSNEVEELIDKNVN